MKWISKPIDTSVKPRRILQLLLGFVALGLVMYAVMSYTNSYQSEGNREAEAKRQRISRSREAAERAREHWGKRYEDWENSVGNPPCIKGKRGELGLTPIFYPTLGIVIIVNDNNQIIRVEQK